MFKHILLSAVIKYKHTQKVYTKQELLLKRKANKQIYEQKYYNESNKSIKSNKRNKSNKCKEMKKCTKRYIHKKIKKVI